MPAIHLKNIPVITFLCLLIILLCTKATFAQDGTERSTSPHFRFKTVIIDAGHGGKDPGAHGAYAKEKTIALAIAKKLRDLINDRMEGIKVVMTRSTDVFIELHKRTDIANDNNGNLFISIHCNSTPQKQASERGPLLLVYGYHRSQEQREALRENAAIYQEKDYKEKYHGYGNDEVINTASKASSSATW
jgi:N-acetylmuramoyl-L-alanine amidase